MQCLKDEEISLQNKIPLLQAQLVHNRNIQTLLLEIVKGIEQEEEKLKEKQEQEELASLQQEEIKKKEQEFLKKMQGKCIFKKRGDPNFCEQKTKKGSEYCVKHSKGINGPR